MFGIEVKMTRTDPERRKISLLYVEDEPDSREMLSKIIRQRYPDVRVLVSENGEAGIESFKLHKPEIVITDINMPITNGIRMAGEIKSMSPSTEIVALTAHTDTEYLLQAIEIGIGNYILKPIDIKQIFKVIDNVLAIIRSEREIERQNEVIRVLNAELEQKAADLELSNQDLESFNYTIAHDLRSPLLTISSISRKLLELDDSKLDDANRRDIQLISQEICRMKGLVTALLNFSLHSRQNVAKKWTDLSKIANEVRKELQTQDPLRKVAFAIAGNISGFCDPDLMRVVLGNLLGNAWKYHRKKNDALIEFATINKEEDLIYFVRDNGEGFNQEDASKIFVPFQRVLCNDGIEGFGIGLATASRIIQRHGGTIWAEGGKGKGATFYFTL